MMGVHDRMSLDFSELGNIIMVCKHRYIVRDASGFTVRRQE